MQYSAYDDSGTGAASAAMRKPGELRDEDQRTHDRAELLRGLGTAVRARRSAMGFTMKRLAELARVSERFLAQLENGEGNISVVRLEDVAEALGTSGAALLGLARDQGHKKNGRGAGSRRGEIVALLGLRGAGKSAIGARVAKKMKVPFVELDALVAREAGMSLATIFDMHGEAYFRKMEREALRKFLDGAQRTGAVVATGGSIVTDAETFAMLRSRALTVWLKARARDHWDRVVAQGDGRPMRDRTNAMSELKTLLLARKPLYAQAAHVVDTSNVSLDEAVNQVLAAANPPVTPKTNLPKNNLKDTVKERGAS
jgi:XRE family transcriptional regulator, aerobic/anaerobic benzoate catabolism transcriptional regulator